MAVHTTRMLLLGAVAMFEPVNGYQIRRELVSWHVDEWANLGPGSIYSGLTTLEKLGQVVRHDLADDGRTVAVYEITPAGRSELARLLGDALERVFRDTAKPEHLDDVLGTFDEMAHSHPEEPHWYLAMIGVEPNAQGRGLGGELMRHALARCDRERAVAYLESSNRRNISLYQRHGFEVMGQIRVGEAPLVVPMIRRPR